MLAGTLLLALNFNWLAEPGAGTWMWLLAAFGALFFLAYLVGPKERWGLLFLALGALVGSSALWLEQGESAGPDIGAAVVLVMSVPFWVGFAVSRGRDWWTLIPGWSMVGVAILIRFESSISDDLFAMFIQFAVALPFFLVFFFKRENWWALIPAAILTATGLMVALLERWRPQFVGVAVLWVMATVFYIVYLRGRENWWALIPAWALTVIGAIVIVSAYWVGALIGSMMMWGIAIPFAVLYVTDRQRWWALIPFGVLATLGMVAALAEASWFSMLDADAMARLLGGIFTGGLALTFASVWLQHHEETRWAIYPALVLGGITLLLVLLGFTLQLIWAVALIAAGLWLLFNNNRARPKA
ncbi:MAG: hypothetical protein R3300_19750 [Candidatus Promineifilaceae bacterium]|nr:hypothetical protein [Candidatus Promineifilaceae bacterium]